MYPIWYCTKMYPIPIYERSLVIRWNMSVGFITPFTSCASSQVAMSLDEWNISLISSLLETLLQSELVKRFLSPRIIFAVLLYTVNQRHLFNCNICNLWSAISPFRTKTGELYFMSSNVYTHFDSHFYCSCMQYKLIFSTSSMFLFAMECKK